MIVGEKVILAGLSLDAAPKILSWVNDPEIKFLTGALFPVSEFEHSDWIQTRAKSQHEKLFLIKDKSSGTYIGTIGLKNIDFVNSNAELYIIIGDKCFRGSGFGTDAIIVLVNFCFTMLNLHKVYLRVFEYNSAGIRTYEKTGFKVEGTLKEHHFANGKYYDVILMAIINNKDS